MCGGVSLHVSPPRPPPSQVQNLGCFAVRDVALRLALPSLGYGRVPFLSVTGVRAENVSGQRGGGGGVPQPYEER